METTKRVPATYHLIQAREIRVGDVIKVTGSVVSWVEDLDATYVRLTYRHGPTGVLRGSQRIGVLRRKEA